MEIETVRKAESGETVVGIIEVEDGLRIICYSLPVVKSEVVNCACMFEVLF